MDSGEGGQVEINPVIRGGKVVRLEVCGREWPLKAEISMEEFLKVMEGIQLLAKYVDLGKIGTGPARPLKGARWSREELRAFLRERNEAQRAFLEVLAEKGEVTRKELLQELRSKLGRPDYSGKDLAGIIAGINRRIGALGKEQLFEIERRRIGGHLDGVYRLKEAYRDLLLELLLGTGKP